MAQAVFPEVVEAMLKRSAVSKRVFPYFMRIGANAGANFAPGTDSVASLLLAPSQEIMINYMTPSKGYVRLLRMHACAWIKNGSQFWMNENQEKNNPLEISSYLKFISANISIASAAREIVAPAQRQENFSNGLDGNLSDLVGNLFPGHSRTPYLLGPNDFVTLKLRNNAPFPIYVGGCLFGYRIMA